MNISQKVSNAIKATANNITAMVDGDKGLYISVSPVRESVNKLRLFRDMLLEYASDEEIDIGVQPIINWHVTVIYSKTNPENLEELYDNFALDAGKVYEAKVSKIELWDGHKNQGVIVLMLDCPELVKLNKKFQDSGLKVSFPDYDPHITLADSVYAKTDKAEAEKLVEELNDALGNISLKLTGIMAENVS